MWGTDVTWWEFAILVLVAFLERLIEEKLSDR